MQGGGQAVLGWFSVRDPAGIAGLLTPVFASFGANRMGGSGRNDTPRASEAKFLALSLALSPQVLAGYACSCGPGPDFRTFFGTAWRRL
jgi:hypothetical protein